MRRGKYVTVIGSSTPLSSKALELSYELGKELAERGFILVCGGRGGVMEAAAKGAKEAGGTTIGILPGVSRDEANPYIDIAIPTGLGQARNQVNVLAGDVVIVVEGQAGTLSEIGLALAHGKPVIALKGSGGVADLLAGKTIGKYRVLEASSVKEAVKKAVKISEGNVTSFK